jgi:hypothetical protein
LQQTEKFSVHCEAIRNSLSLWQLLRLADCGAYESTLQPATPNTSTPSPLNRDSTGTYFCLNDLRLAHNA